MDHPSPLRRALRLPALLLLAWALGGSALVVRDTAEQVRRFTRQIEFDFATWTLDAASGKLAALGLGAAGYLPEVERRALVREYAERVAEASRLEADLVGVVVGPGGAAGSGKMRSLEDELAGVRARLSALRPIVESVMEEQLSQTLAEIGLAVGGRVFPPVSFHFTGLPLALIVSPRQVVRQDANIQLQGGLSLEAITGLEDSVEDELGVSALVVPVGGIGTYPTMVMESSALSWLFETVAHEWIHNYLTLRPLGLLYDASPELRTMNETTASLLGTEIGRLVLLREYPDLVPPPAVAAEAAPGEAPAFDFRAEMHETRVTVDALLAGGQVDEAEAYMEERRQLFWGNGYRIRRLNQAYFAFYGAYADEPGGAAGADPVGEAVRRLRELSASPAEFLRRMAWLDSFADLEEVLGGLVNPD